MATAEPMVADLRAESDDLDALVADLPAERWATATPAPGWTIAHQIAHLLWTDRVALTSVTDEPGFAEVLAEAGKNPTGFVDAAAEELATTPPDRLLADWRRTRADLHEALLGVAEGRKLPWFGPPMSAPSMATARLMETWAHGLDVADALGVQRPASACAPATSRSPSMALCHRQIRSVSSCAPQMGRRGSGVRRTPRNASPDRRRTSACWSPSAGPAPSWTSRRSATTPSGGSVSRRHSPVRRERVATRGRPRRRPCRRRRRRRA
jgi:uncharacterized protein (TIGR03083 family)